MRRLWLTRTFLYPCALAACVVATVPILAQAPDETVIVTATRLPRSVDDVAATVNVIGQGEIERQIVEDLDDLTRYRPSVSMETASHGGNQGFVIRGIGGNRVLTIVDGVRSSDQYFAGPSSYGKDLYETDDIRSVEVISGPASVFYGADALGGAVIIHTKNPIDYVSDSGAPYLSARMSGASANDLAKVGFTGAFQSNNWGTLTQYTRRKYSESELPGTVQRNPLEGQSDALSLKAVGDLPGNGSLIVALQLVDESIDTNLLSEQSASVSQSLGSDESTRRQFNMGYSWEGEGRLADALEARVYVQSTDALQHTDQQRTSYSFINPVDPSTFGGTEAARSTDFEFNQLTKGVSLTTRKRLGIPSSSHELVYGISLETTDTERPRDRCETALEDGITTCAIAAYPFAPPEEFPNRTFPDTRTERSGVFLQDEIVAGSRGRITLIPGIRYDNYRMDPAEAELAVVGEFGFEVTEVSADNLSVNLGLLYDVSSQISLSLQYSEGFRPPNFDESNQAFVNRAFGYATVPNPDLKPETSDGIEFGIRVSRGRARFGFTVYRNQYDDFINSEFVRSFDGISLFQDRNVGRAEISGFEFSAGWDFNDRLTLHGALAQSRGTDLSSGDPLDNVEPLSGVLGLIARGPNENWELETLLTLVAKKDRVSSDDRVMSDAYGLIDIVGKLRPSPRTSLRVGIFNALDESYSRWANLQGRAADDVNAIALAQASGRNLRAAFNFDF